MAWIFDTERITGILEEAGFDTVVQENVSAVRDEGGKNYQMYINSKGRIRFQYSELLKSFIRPVDIQGKSFNYDFENRDIINVTGQLGSIDELVSFLGNIMSVINKGREKGQ